MKSLWDHKPEEKQMWINMYSLSFYWVTSPVFACVLWEKNKTWGFMLVRQSCNTRRTELVLTASWIKHYTNMRFWKHLRWKTGTAITTFWFVFISFASFKFFAEVCEPGVLRSKRVTYTSISQCDLGPLFGVSHNCQLLSQTAQKHALQRDL